MPHQRPVGPVRACSPSAFRSSAQLFEFEEGPAAPYWRERRPALWRSGGDTVPHANAGSDDFNGLEAMIAELTSTTSAEEAKAVLAQIDTALTVAVPDAELVELLDELWAHFSTIDRPPSPHSPHVDFVASAWLGITYREARAVATLAKADLLDASVANARVAFEHAIYLSLISDARDYVAVLDALEHRLVTGWTKALNKTAEPEAQLLLPLLSRMDEDLDVPAEMRWVSRVHMICAKLATGDVVYQRYRLLSNDIHAGLGSASPYILSGMVGNGRSVVPNLVVARAGLDAAVHACVWAGWSIDALFGVELFANAVAKAADRLECTRLTRIVD